MTDADFRDALRLLQKALDVMRDAHLRPENSAALRRELQRLGLQFDLLRSRLGQTTGGVERN